MRPIDADALKVKFCNHCDERDCKPDATDTVYGCVIADTIDSMPTIEAEPVKHVRWIIDYAEGTKIYHAHCSECNKEPDRNIGGDYYIDKLSDYCPNCGAKMDGDSE